MTGMRPSRPAALGAALCAATLALACELEPTRPPPVAGPSALAVTLTLAAVPDVLPRDGLSSARIAVRARGARGLPLARLSLLVEVVAGEGSPARGELSTRWLVTDADGRAQLVYTAPHGPPPMHGGEEIVSIRMTPVGDDYGQTTPRIVRIRLIPAAEPL